MFKKAMVNTFYTIGMFGAVILGWMALEKRSFVLVFIAIFSLVFFVLQKVKFLKQIKNMQKPK
jgi:hypothetical protein